MPLRLALRRSTVTAGVIALLAASVLTIQDNANASTASSPATAEYAPDADSATEAAALTFAAEHNVEQSTAEAMIADQEATAELTSDMGFTLGIDADLWIDQVGPYEQRVHLRTKNAALISEAEYMQFNRWSHFTFLTVHDEVPLASQGRVITDDTTSRVQSVTSRLQGLYVDTEDKALVIETLDTLTQTQINAIKTSTGYPLVRVNTVPDAAADHIRIRGGARMAACTTAFPVTKGTTRGFLTAAHCETNQAVYQGIDASGTSATSVKRDTVRTDRADIAFFTVNGTHTYDPFIYREDAGNLFRQGTAAADVGDGTRVCTRGWRSGWRCGDVSNIAYRPTWGGACPAKCAALFVRVGTSSRPGDSGGPWVVGTRPVGVHKGGSLITAVYSKIQYMPSGIKFL